jgi:DNA primase
VPGRINEHDIRALRERADLAVIAGDYTRLSKAGGRLKGLCPFHEEKTPSFHVDPSRGFFHCFGCQAGGDVFDFLQRVEALDFPEAVERAARIEGFELRYEELSPGQRKALGRRTRLVEALAEAAAFYREQLAGETGRAARDYLASRGLSADDAAHFGLGWAPDAWDSLSRHLRGRFEPGELIEAGLATDGRRGPLDRFRGRVIFPVYDRSGKDVVAFGGRVLPGVTLQTGPKEGTPPKYINSSESPVYRKSETLYGLNWARAEVQRRGAALVVEGYTDVIAMHLAGASHAVATCGTALTADHFRQLEKFAPKVILALDADEAGYAAADRARELAGEVGVREVAVLALPAGQDPADLAAAGQGAVEEALAGVRTAVGFQIEWLLRSADTSTPEGQVDAYRRTFPLLARLDDRFLRFGYIRDVVAPAVRISADRIEAELDRHVEADEGGSQPVDPGQDHGGASRFAGAAQPTPGRGPGDLTAPGLRDPQMWLERQVLQAALQRPDLLPDSWEAVDAADFRAPMSRQLFTALASAAPGDLDGVLDALPDDEVRGRVRALAMADATVEPDSAHYGELVGRLLARSVERERAALDERLRTQREQLPAAERRELLTQRFELDRRRRELLEGRRA